MNDRLPENDSMRDWDGFQNRRAYERHLGKVAVKVFRDSDKIREGLAVALVDISLAGMRIVSPVLMSEGEQVRLVLRNDIQRFQKDYRGIVRWHLAVPNQTFQIGIELLARVSSVDLMALKRAGLADSTLRGKVWM